MTTFTRQAVRELVLDEFQLGRRGTNTGTSQTAITDVLKFSGPTAAEGIEVGSEVLITSGTGAPADEFARLNSKPKRLTGVMDLDRTLTAALANGDTFEVLYPDISFDGGPNSIHQAMNDVLAEFPWEKRQVPITLAADGDMLVDDVDDWTAATAVLVKSAASFPLGLRVMVVIASSPNGYARTATIAVEPSESYYLEATGYRVLGVGGGTLILSDVTNGAPITLINSAIDSQEPILLMNPSVTIPSDSNDVQVKLETTIDLDSVAWANVILRKNSAREFTIQDRPVRILRLGRLLATKVDTWGARGDRWDEVPAKQVQRDSAIWQYHSEVSLSGWSVWYEEYVEPVAMTSDTDTTNVNKRELAALTAERVLRPLARTKKWRDRYAFAASAAASVRLAFDSRRTVLDQRTRVYPIARA